LLSALSVAFIDIGQGDATVAHLPGGANAVVVDCGSTGDKRVHDHLSHIKVKELPLVVLTHSDDDHIGGIMTVLENFRGRVGEIAFNPDRIKSGTEEKKYVLFLRRLAQFSRQRGSELSTPLSPHRWLLDGVQFRVLHPSGADHLDALAGGMRNDGSMVILTEYAGMRLLLAADIQGQGWQWVAAREADLRAQVFKLSHHGAWHTNGLKLPEVLTMVEPDLIVVSVGAPNPYGHPAEKTLEALGDYLDRSPNARVLCTELASSDHSRITAAGTIRIDVTVDGVTMSTPG